MAAAHRPGWLRARGLRYYGRGYVQLTWKKNYKKMSDLIPQAGDLVQDPSRALLPEVAYSVASVGMRGGHFTGVSLFHFIHGAHCDYRSARQIINALDRADEIERFAIEFECLLLLSTLA